MASMKSSSYSSSAAAATAATAATQLISRCTVGSAISITSNSCMRYEGVLESVHLQDELICLNNVRSFGTEGRRKDSALVLPDDRVFDNVQFRGSDIKEFQVLSGPPADQALAFPHDPAIIQYCPLRLALTLADSARDINGSREDDCDFNTGSKLTIKENLSSTSPTQALMSFSASKLSTNNWKPPMQGVSGILGGVTCVCPRNSLDMQPTLAEYNWKQPTQSSRDNVFPNSVFSSQVSLTSSTPCQTGPPCIASSVASLPIASSICNLSPDVIPKTVAPENSQTLSLSFGSSGTITGQDTYAVGLQMVDRLSPLLGSRVPPQSLSQSMASKNQIIETIHSNKLELSSQESPNHVLPTGPLAVCSLHLRGDVPEDMEPLKNLVPCSGSTESKGCSELISSLSTHAKTSSSVLKSVSQATIVSSSLLPTEKMNKGNVRDNVKVAIQPGRNIFDRDALSKLYGSFEDLFMQPMFHSGEAKDTGQTNVDNMKNGMADGHTFQRRQPRKICSFRRTSKVSQLPTNYSEECYVRSKNGKSDKTGVYDHSNKIEQAPLESKRNTRNIYVRKSEKVADKAVHAKDDLSWSPVTSERELTKRNSKMPDQAEANGGSTMDRKDRSSGRFPKWRVSADGTGRGSNLGRSQAESIGKHIT